MNHEAARARHGARRHAPIAVTFASCGALVVLLADVASGQRPNDPPAAALPAASAEPELAWLLRPGAAPIEPSRVQPDACLLEDLQYMRAPLFRVRGAAGSRVRLRPATPGVRPSRYSDRRRRRVAAGSIVLGSRVVEGHRCVYAASPRGLRTGFLPIARLERIDDPAPAGARALLGDWFEGATGRWVERGVPANHVRIRAGRGETLHLRGEASWGGGDHPDLHTGGFDAPIHQQDGLWVGEHDCRIALRMRGPFLMIDDEGICGGMNVSFAGIYVRASSPIPFVLDAL